MKIYIITKGDYSDYHICNVTTDYQKAKRYKEAYSDKWSEAWIEVYEDGEKEKERYCWIYNPVSHTAEISDYNENERVLKTIGDKIYRVVVYADTKKHAIKKAQDMIANYKAEQAGL